MHRLRVYPTPDRVLLGLAGVYLFIYVFAVPMLIFDLVPAWGTWMGGFLLILQGTILGVWLIRCSGVRGGLAALLILALAFSVEYMGVTTGFPFGRYSYSTVLGLKLLGAVPLPIPFAWLLVVPAALGVAGPWARGRAQVGLAGLLALGLDLLIEPVAAHVVHYWQWQDGGPYYGVPTANFIAWSVTALLLAALCAGLTRRAPQRRVLTRLPAALYVLNVLQFTLVDLARGYRVAVVVGVVLLLGVAAAWRERALPVTARAT